MFRPAFSAAQAWRRAVARPSLPEIYRSLRVPQSAGHAQAPGLCRAGLSRGRGLHGPGNWATDLAGGSTYNYTLLSVIQLSNLMAVLQPWPSTWAWRRAATWQPPVATTSAVRYHLSLFWIMVEVAIAACDLAAVIGSAIALNLLFHIPLLWGVCLTSLDVLLILFRQQKGFRFVEALVISLNRQHWGLLRGEEILFSTPSFLRILPPFVTDHPGPGNVVYRIGTLRATVMPHNFSPWRCSCPARIPLPEERPRS